MSDAPSIVAMRGVSKCYTTSAGAVRVLEDVDVAIEPAQFVGVTGPSGSGKTTFLNLCALLDRPTTGRVLVEGVDVSGADERERRGLRKRKMGMVFQDFHLLPYRSVLENVCFRFRYLDVPRAEARDLAEQALARVGLTHLAAQPARLLSGGEMQRVAIARAIALPPRLLLSDEPTGNIDGESARRVMEHFRDLNRQGITIVMATHNLALLEYCNRHLACEARGVRDA